MTTIFERMLAGEVPVKPVYEDEHVLAFADLHPAAPVHVLVIPKVKAQSFAEFADASPEQVGHYMVAVAKAARQLGLEGPGYRIVFNHGADGQQTIPYVHAHILGGRPLNWPPG